jgi:hypothetical protein
MTMVSEFFLLEPCWQGLGEGLGGGGGGWEGSARGGAYTGLWLCLRRWAYQGGPSHSPL